MADILKRRAVQDSVLILGEDVIPLSQVSVGFTIDQIPKATCVPVLGRQLGTDKYRKIEDIPHDAEAKIYLRVDGQNILLLHGYVNTIAAQASYSISTVNNSASVVVIHRASKMFGSPFANYSYVTSNINLANSIKNRVGNNIFGTKGLGFGTGKDLADNIYDNSIKAGRFPAQIIRDFAYNIAKTTLPEDLAEMLNESLIAYPGANYERFDIGIDKVYETIHKAFVNTIGRGSLGQGFQQAIAAMMLNFVPTNDSLIIGNPMSLTTEIDVDIKSGEYAGMSANSYETVTEPVDHVLVQLSKKSIEDAGAESYSSQWFAFPPFKDKGGNVISSVWLGAEYPDGAYIHRTVVPQWITEQSATRPARDTDSARAIKTQKVLDDDQYTLGEEYAQMYYAYLSGKRFNVPNLVLPFRTDIMPGTIIRLNGADADVFGSSKLVGMVDSVLIRCNAGTNLSMQVGLKDVRPDSENKSYEEGGRCLRGTGLYSERWKPIDLWGTTLDGESFSEDNLDRSSSAKERAEAAAESWLKKWEDDKFAEARANMIKAINNLGPVAPPPNVT